MSKRTEHIRYTEKEMTLAALEEAAKRMEGPYPALTLINELLTESEKLTIGRRILIAQMILAGMTQAEINYTLSVSPNTFCRTRKWLEGQIPNYDDALREAMVLENERSDKRYEERSSRKQYAPANTFRGMRQRYPAHFLFFNLADELFKHLNKRSQKQ